MVKKVPKTLSQPTNTLSLKERIKEENAKIKVNEARVELNEARVELNAAATRGAAVAVVSRSNLKTLPPLMINDVIRNANVCISARDAYHDGLGATSIFSNELFKLVQRTMFGENWAQTCHAMFGSQTTATDITNGTWLSAPHNDIFWSTVTDIKTRGKNVIHTIVPRFGMKLQPYDLEFCITAIRNREQREQRDEEGQIGNDNNVKELFYIVDNLNARSPKNKSTAVIQTLKRVTISEIFDRAGRSYTGDRLQKLKEWWAESVLANPTNANIYPDIIIPLDYVGEITIQRSVLSISLFQRDVLENFDTVMNHHKSQDTRLRETFHERGVYHIVKAALLFRFFIPGITVEGVPGVVNSGTEQQPIFTYDTYVFIHENGSVSYSREDNANYPDNTEKNLFYNANNPVAPGTVPPVQQGTLYNLCKSIGDSAAVWTASVKTFIHTTDTGLIIRCIFNGRYCVITIREKGVSSVTYIVSPELAGDLFNINTTQIPRSPRPILPDQVISATPLATKKQNISFGKQFTRLLQSFDKNSRLKNTPNNTKLPSKPRYSLRSSINKYNLRSRRSVQKGGAIFIVPDDFNLTRTLNELLGTAYKRVIFNGKIIKEEDTKKSLAELEIANGSKLMIFEPTKDATVSNIVPEVDANVNDAQPVLKIGACRYFLTLLLYMVSFYSDTPVEDGGINNFALPETTDVVVFFADEVSNSGVTDAVPNPFQDNAVTKPVVKFISFTEFQPKIQEFLTLLKDFVKVFVSNIALITEIKILPKKQVMSTESGKDDDASDNDKVFEGNLNLIRAIISGIPVNEDSSNGNDGINEINTYLREVLRAGLLPSVLLRIDNINIKNSYLESDSYKALKLNIDNPNFFYLPNATSNIFDVVDNIVYYFGPVFSNSYDGIDLKPLPVISPEVKISVVNALEEFKQGNRLYAIPTQIKFNTRAVTTAKIFDNICEILNGKPLSDSLNHELKAYIEHKVLGEVEKLKKHDTESEGGESNPSLSEQINNNIEATARDNILREFMEQMATYFVDGEMEDFEKESMRALIDLNATYGFNVEGIDYLHLNDIIYNIFVQEIMYTGVHIHRVDFLQDFINNIGFSSGELIYMDNINDALEASNSISNEKLTELKIKGYSLSEIIGLLYELRDKTTESTSDEDVTSIINGVLNQEVSPVPKPTQPIQQQIFNPPPLLPQDTRALVSPVGTGGKNNRISNPKHNTKYRKNYKKFVSKYIIKKKKKNNKNNKNNNKNNKKNNKNKTRKNKRLIKSKRNNKTLKNKKGKSKSSNHKSNHKSKFNKKTKTNYYNFYKHNKTLKH